MTKEEKLIEKLTLLYSGEKTQMTELYIKIAEKSLSYFGWKRLHEIPNTAGICIECILRNGIIEKKYVNRSIDGYCYLDGYYTVLMWRYF